MSLFGDTTRLPPSDKLRRRRTAAPAAPREDPLFVSDDDSAPAKAAPEPARSPASSANGSLWAARQQELFAPLALVLLSAFTRLYRIGRANRVIWDEAHFGKFGAHYVNRTFYSDVHPPLAKMLVGLSEILTGFDGVFDFQSGAEYPPGVNYTFMRAFNAAFGIPLAPMAYFTLLNLGCSPGAALLGGLLVCVDNALCTISRFILLDAMLLCFTAMCVLSLSGLYKHRTQSFRPAWWRWLFATGVSLGLVTSAKWVGAFSVALVGLYTVYELYDMLGLPEMRVAEYAMHWASRAAALIAVPLAIYMLCFGAHFAVLSRSGPGDADMDSLFQAGLEGSGLKHQPLDVAYGSKITIKSAVSGVGLLHSHPHTYPEGSKQQQITGYSHKDVNNIWIVNKVHGQAYGNTTETVEFVRNGDVVRLVHEATARNLHSHPVAAYASKRDREVSGYGEGDRYPDTNDHWRVEVVEELSKKNPDRRLRTLISRFRLRHVSLGCVLRASGKSLPQWAWSQAGMVCDQRNHLDENTLWNVEQNTNGLLPAVDPKDLKSPFLRNFWRLNLAMGRINNALVPDQDKIDRLKSEPYDWPIMRLGLRICGWNDDAVKFWLIGNPVVWLGSTLALVLGTAQLAYYLVRRQRGLRDFGYPGEWERHLYVSGILQGGWLLHYAPFFTFGRVLYLHHYFPALYFAAMYMAYIVDWNIRRIAGPAAAAAASSARGRALLGAIGAAAIANFVYFAPFTFGFDYPAKELAGRKWFSTWNVYD
ncbi:Protein O-mannosyltransferase 2 [Coemansia sp. RSA 552]|nr:Protein O-mannosyltransferase 2 [Coemansia sp. RSA 552]